MSMFDQLDSVVKRFEELTEKMADPTLYDRQAEFKAVSTERGNIEDLVQKLKQEKVSQKE